MGATQSAETKLKLDEFSKDRKHHSGLLIQFHNLLLRTPYLIEDFFGVNMNYYYALNVPTNVLTVEERRLIKANEMEDLKSLIFREMISIDDPIDIYSKHTILHDAVIMNREQLFYFVLQ